MTIRPTLRGVLLVVALLLAAAVFAWAWRPRPVDVDVAAVTRGAFVKSVDEDGKTRVRERYVVSAPFAGRLLRIRLKAGDEVQPGSELATLLPSEPALLDVRTEQELNERVGAAEARRQATTAGVERQKAALALARSELERVKGLGNQGFVSKQTVDRAERDAEIKAKELAVSEFDDHAAEHDIALARAALTDARLGAKSGRDRRWIIRSPVAGRVLRVAQESEAVVPLGAPLLEIGDPHAVEAVVDVLTTDAESIRPGAAVTLDRAGAAPLVGRVRLVEPSAFTKVSALGVEEQRVNVVVDILDPSADLGDGYRVDAHIVVDRRDDALLVPTAALFRRGDAWAAFVVADGRARERKVIIGPRNATHALVEEGLQAGERVIVYPPDAVGDNVRVRAARAKA